MKGIDDDNISSNVKLDNGLSAQEPNPAAGEEALFGLPQLLESVSYPATKEDLLDYASDSGAEEAVLDMLERLPDTTYNSPTDVSQALGENGSV